MQQKSLTDSFEKYRKKTRKEQVLEEMDTIIPLHGGETCAWGDSASASSMALRAEGLSPGEGADSQGS